LSKDTVWYRFIDRFFSLRVLADGLSRKGSDCPASAPIILHCICAIALDMRDLAGEMLLPSGILSISCAGMA
jgi:hypothetical protein